MTRLLFATVLAAQTIITPPDNQYSPAEDVKLGLQAAAQAEQQLPIMRDDEITSYIENIGQRLVSAIPSELRHSEFKYTFKAVNVREINAFALPGGPMYVNRGMIEAARTEGEVAGVMAHELSHVVLRHGTAQASKATKYEFGTLAGAVLGAIIGGRVGTVVAEGTRFGLGTAFLRFSREFEKQADLEGAQIMARAGYDSRDMANMFKTIEKQGGSGGPQWLSDHPNPGDRSQYIEQEAARLRVEKPIRDTREFSQAQAHLKNLPKAPTTEEATRKAGNASSSTESRPPAGSVERPSTRWTRYTEADLFRVDVPSNWRELQGTNTVTFAPEGSYGTVKGQGVFTHGVELGVSRNETHDLQTASEELVASLRRTNPDLRTSSSYERSRVGNRNGLHVRLSNQSEATGRPETIELFTTLLRDRSVFYVIGVSPRDDFSDYENSFQRVVESLQISE
jgi:hypothetical protein